METPQSKLQDDEYCFPYHYVTQFREGRFTQHFVDTWGINYAITLSFLLERLNQLAPSSIVDIGCGDGRLTREISFFPFVNSLLGIDYSERAINLASAMNPDRANLQFCALDINSSRDHLKYDAVLLIEVFEHIPLDMAANFIRSVHSYLKPGGKLLLTVPHVNKPVEYKHYQHFSTTSLAPYFFGLFNIDNFVPFEKSGRIRDALNWLLCNRYFVLNSRRLQASIFEFHRKYLFHCADESNCQRLYLEATAI